MRILFDHQIYTNQNYGGISRYFYELSKGLTSLGNECKNSVYFSENEYTKDTIAYKTHRFIPFYFKGRERLKGHLNQMFSERSLRKGAYDIFHPTYYDPYFLKTKSAQKPFVVTFYDLIHEKFSGRYPTLLTNMDQVISNRMVLLNSASRIIAISESTKRDLVEYYGIAPDQIHVTHLASSLFVPESVPDRLTKYGKYILFVGTRMGYKNYTFFLESVSELLRRETDLRLICAGGGSFSPEEEVLIQRLGLAGKVQQLPINDHRLAMLYKNALFFVFPSLYEGFGIPVLEAFNCGCPAIISNASSLPEVGGDAALYVDPEDASDILGKCERLYADPELRDYYRAKGLEQASNFSWQKVAAQTLNIYQSAL